MNNLTVHHFLGYAKGVSAACIPWLVLNECCLQCVPVAKSSVKLLSFSKTLSSLYCAARATLHKVPQLAGVGLHDLQYCLDCRTDLSFGCKGHCNPSKKTKQNPKASNLMMGYWQLF